MSEIVKISSKINEDRFLWKILNEATEKFRRFSLLYGEFVDLFRVRAGRRFTFRHEHFLDPLMPIYSLNMDPRDWYGYGSDTVSLDCPAEGKTEDLAKERMKRYLDVLAEVVISKYHHKCVDYGYDYPGVVHCGSRAEIKPQTATFLALADSFHTEAKSASGLHVSKFGETEICCLDEGRYSVMAKRAEMKNNTIYFVTET